MKMYIRVDGNKTIGSGHIMRCLSIADALKAIGVESVFITADKESAVFFEGKDYERIVLGSDYENMEDEIPKLQRVIKKEKAECLLVDSYFVTASYFQALNQTFCHSTKMTKSKMNIIVSSKLKVAYIDDLMREVYPVDILINYNIYGTKKAYENCGKTALLLGCEYAPLRKEFHNRDFVVREQVKNVLITTGGGDSLNISCALLDKLAKEHSDIMFHVVSGALNTHTEELHVMEAAMENVTVHEKVTNMSELMQSCDVAISAAGSTMYELSAVGIPVIGFYFVENQRRVAEAYAELTPVRNEGNYAADSADVIQNIHERLNEFLGQIEKRDECKQALRKLVDGNGASRLASYLKVAFVK